MRRNRGGQGSSFRATTIKRAYFQRNEIELKIRVYLLGFKDEEQKAWLNRHNKVVPLGGGLVTKFWRVV